MTKITRTHQVCWKYSDSDTIYRGVPSTKDDAETDARENNQDWDGIIRFWVEPVQPDWTLPTVTRISLTRTMMGSPCMGGDDDLDLLGVKPPC